MIDKVLNENIENNSDMQKNCISELKKIFQETEIKNFAVDNYFFIGVRGNYEGKRNYSLHFKFDYFDYLIEFFISYDQLEYYIELGNKKIGKCNLEDYWEEKKMVKKFIAYLKKDLESLNLSD